jgi:hypothetical protein
VHCAASTPYPMARESISHHFAREEGRRGSSPNLRRSGKGKLDVDRCGSGRAVVLGPVAGCFSRGVRRGRPSISVARPGRGGRSTVPPPRLRRTPWPVPPRPRACRRARTSPRPTTGAAAPPRSSATSSSRLAPVPCHAASPEHTEEEEIGEGLSVEREGRRREATGMRRRKWKEEERKIREDERKEKRKESERKKGGK